MSWGGTTPGPAMITLIHRFKAWQTIGSNRASAVALCSVACACQSVRPAGARSLCVPGAVHENQFWSTSCMRTALAAALRAARTDLRSALGRVAWVHEGTAANRKSVRPTSKRKGLPSGPVDDPLLPVVAIVGPPNVGKSALFNRLVKRRDALVRPRPYPTPLPKRMRIQARSQPVSCIDGLTCSHPQVHNHAGGPCYAGLQGGRCAAG